MPYDWESEDFNNLMNPPEVEEIPQYRQQAHAPSMDSEEEIDEVMSEAEKRFEVAQYYKLLLRDNLFQNSSDASEQVESEIRTFIKDRLSVLLGVKAAHATASSFTPEQVQVLSEFADLGEEAPAMLRALMGRINKKMVKQTPKSLPKEEPALKVVKEPTKPALRKVRTEEPRLKHEPEPQQQQSQPQQQAPKQKGGGRKPNVKLQVPIPEEYKNDPTLKVEGTKVFVHARNTDGMLMYRTPKGDIVNTFDSANEVVYKDVTPVAKPIGHIQPIPMPSNDHLGAIMAEKAEKVIKTQSGEGNNLILRQLGTR